MRSAVTTSRYVAIILLLGCATGCGLYRYESLAELEEQEEEEEEEEQEEEQEEEEETALSSGQVVYRDVPGAGWDLVSWSGAWDPAADAPVFEGSYAVRFDPSEGGGVNFMYMYPEGAIQVADFWGLEFFIHGDDPGGQQIRVSFPDAADDLNDVFISAYIEGGAGPDGTWRRVQIPFTALPPTLQSFPMFLIRGSWPTEQPFVTIDAITLVGLGGPIQPLPDP